MTRDLKNKSTILSVKCKPAPAHYMFSPHSTAPVRPRDRSKNLKNGKMSTISKTSIMPVRCHGLLKYFAHRPLPESPPPPPANPLNRATISSARDLPHHNLNGWQYYEEKKKDQDGSPKKSYNLLLHVMVMDRTHALFSRHHYHIFRLQNLTLMFWIISSANQFQEHVMGESFGCYTLKKS